MKRLVILILFVTTTLNVYSQNSCLNIIRSCENIQKEIGSLDAEDKTLFMDYTIKATNWDEEVTTSHVKLYRKGNAINMFSEQANVFMDEREAILVIPVQKLLIVNERNIGKVDLSESEQFLALRSRFLDSCKVESCTSVGKNTFIKLKAPIEKMFDSMILTLEYEVDTESKRVKSVAVTYSEEYKLKKLQIVYNSEKTNAAYDFPKIRETILTKRGLVSQRYAGYEIIDNREPSKLATVKGKR